MKKYLVYIPILGIIFVYNIDECADLILNNKFHYFFSMFYQAIFLLYVFLKLLNY